MQLDSLPRRMPARITAIDWTLLSDDEGQRLRALGLDEGAEVEVRHRGMLMGRDPLAVRIGRTLVALRRRHARVVTVAPLAQAVALDAGSAGLIPAG